MFISRLVIIITITIVSNWSHSIHCLSDSVCQRSDPGFNKCVAEKLNDLRVTVAKGNNLTNRSDTKIGNWTLITSCAQLVPTPNVLPLRAPYYVFFICDQLYRLKTTLLLLLLWQLGTLYESQVAYFHSSFYTKICLRSWKNHEF